MNNQSFSKATYYPSTHPVFMSICFGVISILIAFYFKNNPHEEIKKWQVVFSCSLFFIGALIFVFKAVHCVYFTNQGLVFRRFGKTYRTVKWEEIIQAGIGKEYKATKLTLVFTLEGTSQYDQTIHSTTTLYLEKNRRKLILMDATKENIQNTEKFYGNLDYAVK